MPTTNAATAKKALIDLLKAQTAPGGLLEGSALGLAAGETVDVQYAYHANVGALSLYGGGWRMDASDAVSEGVGLLVRELVTVSLYVRVVARPVADVEDTDAKATIVSNAMGTVLKTNPKLGGQLAVLAIVSGQGDYSVTNDETISIQGFQVLVSSMVSYG